MTVVAHIGVVGVSADEVQYELRWPLPMLVWKNMISLLLLQLVLAKLLEEPTMAAMPHGHGPLLVVSI